VGELVENRDPDLALELVGVRKRLLERDPVDRDPVGELARVARAALGQRDAVVEPEQVGVVGMLVFDDDRDVLERTGEIAREGVERGADVVFERRQ
jgi:hypothetical protein